MANLQAQINSDTNEGIDVKRYLKYMSIVALAVTLTNPIELVKSRIQTSPELLVKGSIKTPYVGAFNTLRRVITEEGFKGIWKGVGYFVMRTIPSNMGVFTIKELIHRKLTRYVRQGDQNSFAVQQLTKHYVIVNSLIGGTAGLAIQVLIYPFDYFRIILSNEIQHPGYGMIKRITETIKQRGYAGIFKGILMNLFYMTSARGVYFGLYDSYKGITDNEILKLLMSYGSISTALWVNYPLDTIRKRLILAPKRYANGRECLRAILKQESFRALFSGWRTVFFQSVSFCTLFYLYDIIFTEIFNKKKKN